MVEYADTAFLSQRYRQTGFGHRIHGGGDQRQIQVDVARQVRGERDVAWQNGGVSWDKQDIVERQSLVDDSHLLSFVPKTYYTQAPETRQTKHPSCAQFYSSFCS